MYRIVAVSLAVAVVTGAVAGQDRSVSASDILNKTDPSIVAIVSGGSWEVNDRRGVYRVIVQNRGWDHVSSRVFVQWVEENAAQESLTVAKTVEVTEFSGGLLSVGLPVLVRDDTSGHVVLKLGAAGTTYPEEYVFEATLADIGHYQVVKWERSGLTSE